MRRAGQPRRRCKVQRAVAQHLAACLPRQPGPGDQREHDRDQNEALRYSGVARQRRGDRGIQRQRRDRLDQLDQALHQVIGGAAEIARGRAEDRADHRRDRHADQADEHRDAGALQHAAVHVAPLAIGPPWQQLGRYGRRRRRVVRRRRCRRCRIDAEQMDVAFEHAEHAPGESLDEEADRDRHRTIGGVFKSERFLVKRLGYAAHRQPAVGKTYLARRGILVVGIDLIVRVGREKRREHRHEIHDHQHDAAGYRKLALHEAPHHQPPLRDLRGSARLVFLDWAAPPRTCPVATRVVAM